MKSSKKGRNSIKGVILIILALILIGGGLLVYTRWFGSPKGNEVVTISESALRGVFEDSKLSTVQYTYNAVAHKYDGDKLKYHVAYDGIVKAGIDFSKISINVDNENKIITVMLPPVVITETIVTDGTLEYIFEKQKYNEMTVSSEASALCKDDLDKRAKQEPELINQAKENTISTVKGLIEPWVKQIDEEYIVEVK